MEDGRRKMEMAQSVGWLLGKRSKCDCLNWCWNDRDRQIPEVSGHHPSIISESSDVPQKAHLTSGTHPLKHRYKLCTHNLKKKKN